MFKQFGLFQNGFDSYVNALGLKTYSYGNATHAFADVLRYLDGTDRLYTPEILMPSFIPAKLYKTILAYGYIPRFYEIDENCQFDPDEITQLIDRRTKAICVIHYFGHPAKVKQLREIADQNNLILIEDCAHVIFGREFGGRLGTWGDFSIFSSRKMLNLPEGGYLVLNKLINGFEPSYSKRVNSLYTLSKLLLARGKCFYLSATNGKDILKISRIPQRGFIDYNRISKSPIKNISLLTSYYSRLTDIRVHIEKRQQNYNYLYDGLKSFSFLKPLFSDASDRWTPYSLPMIVEKGYRDKLQSVLNKSGISCGAGWPESPFEKRFSRTLQLSKNLIEFPVHPFVNENQLNKIFDCCTHFENSTITPEREILFINSSSNSELTQTYSNTKNSSSVHWQDIKPEYLLNNTFISFNEKKFSNEKIKIEIISTNEGFDNLRTEWETLCDESNSQIFQTFEWQRIWWKYYGKGKHLHLVLFYSKNIFDVNKLIGIAPFFIDCISAAGFLLIKRLRLIGSGVNNINCKESMPEYAVSDYLDIIAHKDYEKQVAKALEGYLKETIQDLDIVQLDEAYTDSVICKYLLPSLYHAGLRHHILPKEVCPRIVLPESLDKYYLQLNSKVRYQLKKIRKDLSDDLSFSIKEIKTRDELEQYFDDFVDLHQKRWKYQGYSGLFNNEDYRKFLKEITHAFLKKDNLYFTIAHSDNECIAAECAFKYKKMFYDYLKAFNDQSPMAKYRPGKMLMISMIDYAIDKGFEIIDLLRGSESYKFEIATEWHCTYKIILFPPENKLLFKYRLFIMILSLVYVKHSFFRELSIIRAHIKNFGITGFAVRYFPRAFRRFKSKMVPSTSFALNESRKEFGLKKASTATKRNVNKIETPEVKKIGQLIKMNSR